MPASIVGAGLRLLFAPRLCIRAAFVVLTGECGVGHPAAELFFWAWWGGRVLVLALSTASRVYGAPIADPRHSLFCPLDARILRPSQMHTRRAIERHPVGDSHFVLSAFLPADASVTLPLPPTSFQALLPLHGSTAVIWVLGYPRPFRKHSRLPRREKTRASVDYARLRGSSQGSDGTASNMQLSAWNTRLPRG